jgi:3-phenylpropionate/trans-cinnamate dioxygenase ferredoxin subunit
MTNIGKFSEFESGVAKKVKVDGVAVAVVRIDDEIFAIADKCSHADVSLSDGVVWCETKQLECIKHGSAFNLVTGVPDTLPATQPVAVYEVSVVNDEVNVSLKGGKK